MSQLLAYIARRDDAVAVVYATSGAAARRLGADELYLDFEDIESCRRAKGLDCFAKQGGPTHEHMIENHGWHVECRNCPEEVGRSTEDRVYQHGEAFCSPECLAACQPVK